MAAVPRLLAAAFGEVLVPLVARAQGGFPVLAIRPQPKADLPEVILGATNGALAVIGLVALFYLAYGAYAYATRLRPGFQLSPRFQAGGLAGQVGGQAAARDAEKAAAAKAIVANAAVAIVVLALAAAIVNFVVRGVGGAVPVGVI